MLDITPLDITMLDITFVNGLRASRIGLYPVHLHRFPEKIINKSIAEYYPRSMIQSISLNRSNLLRYHLFEETASSVPIYI